MFFLVPCSINPCTAANNDCTNNADGTRTCSCSSGYAPEDGSDPTNGCDCRFFNFLEIM